MKVYFINSVVDYGSTGKIVRDLFIELKMKDTVFESLTEGTLLNTRMIL